MNSANTSEPLSPNDTFVRIIQNVEQVVSGQSKSLRLILAALASGGHVLLEDFPGTGKTTLAKAIALSLGCTFKRVQFTPDLLPSDILGVSIFDQREQVFNFREGPIFTNILLADEINRASPRTQSALLEAMAEGQVTIEGNSFKLSELFFVIATQNPVEFRGTYPLPEAQMDRFAMRLSLGYVDLESEVSIVLNQRKQHPLESISSSVSLEDMHTLKHAVNEVHISDELQQYAVSIVRATRNAQSVQMGAGPRASLALTKASQALALLDGSDFVTPEHLYDLLTPVIAHRIVLDPKAQFSGKTPESVINEIAKDIPVPG